MFIESGDLDTQMEQIISALHLEMLELFSRCLECNRIQEVETRKRSKAACLPYVFGTQEFFKSCPECSRIYWPGTHHDHIQQRVEKWFDTA